MLFDSINISILLRSYPFPVNGGAALMGGSHIQYVDYVRESFASFMSSDEPASSMVAGMGEMTENVFNLKGEMVGPRNGKSATPVGAHYSNTDANGTYAMLKLFPAQSDWFLQALCSAHLEQKHQVCIIAAACLCTWTLIQAVCLTLFA